MALADELAALLNKYSVESESGTPDFILATYLLGALQNFEQAIQSRTEWRGESVELPALQERTKKKVPLVIYTDGRRNEIGEAVITEWPGEVRVEGNISGVIPLLDRHPI